MVSGNRTRPNGRYGNSICLNQSAIFLRTRKYLLQAIRALRVPGFRFGSVRWGAKVTGYSLPPSTDPNLYVLAGIQHRIISLTGDVRDLYGLAGIIDKTCPDIIFHLAAQSLVGRSYRDTVETFGTNIMGTVNLLEACRKHPSVRAIVVVTSDKCYENQESCSAYVEGDRLGGNDPYSSSKACAELITGSYRESFYRKKPVRGLASARTGNVIGGGDWAEDRLVPDCLRALEREEVIMVRNPLSVRPWQHVLEPLSGYLMLAARLYSEPEVYSGPWNFGPYDASCIAVESLVESIIREWKSGTWMRPVSDQPFGEAKMLRLDSSKAGQRLVWKPKWDVDTTVRKTVEWHKRYMSKADIYTLCTEQIEEYIGI